MTRAGLSMGLLVALATCGAWSLGMPLYFLVLLPANRGDMSGRHFLVALLASAVVALPWAVFSRHVALSCLQGKSARREGKLAAAAGFTTFLLLAGHFVWECYVDWQAYLSTAP